MNFLLAFERCQGKSRDLSRLFWTPLCQSERRWKVGLAIRIGSRVDCLPECDSKFLTFPAVTTMARYNDIVHMVRAEG
jgi:hypothetical protein